MFFKKVRGALWVCMWNQGGRWTEKVWEPLEQSMTKKSVSYLGICQVYETKFRLLAVEHDKDRLLFRRV